jgi:hypothetical protein
LLRRDSRFSLLDLAGILGIVAVAYVVSSALQLSEFRTNLSSREFGCALREGNNGGRKHGGYGNCLEKDFHDGILNLIGLQDCSDMMPF